MIGRVQLGAWVVVSIVLILQADRMPAGPTTTPATTRPVESQPYASIAAAHVGRLRARLSEIDDALGAAGREEHDRLLIEKMSALFELLTLEGRPLDPLDRLASEAGSHDPGEQLAAAAEYWRLRIALSRDAQGGASQPAAGAAIKLVEHYIDAHPRSPYVAVLISEVIDSAYVKKDLAAVDRMLGRLKQEFPSHPITSSLLGGDRLRRALGEVWNPPLKDAQGQLVDWNAFHGGPTLVLFWATWDAASKRTLRQLAAWPAVGGANRPFLVAISLDRQPVDAETALRKAGLPAIVCCDGMGWRSEIVDAWGIRSLPVGLLLDDSGHLRAVIDGVDSNFDSRLRDAWKSAGGRLE